ncbi:hypothetical protein KIW84_031829 [Lathyrus oleraceus]|uniref:Uncharacterized protein n=1 Tax=Pisum sativum TaxID=3888 RepID=A0A9D4XRJ5_PEA|nr:hypothetical protein KIW84_031829 [Pisum sativum]
MIEDHNPQFQVYVRKRFHKGITNPIVSPAKIQSDLPSEGPTEISPSSSSSGNPSYSSNDLLDLSFPDINLPIALREKILDLNIPITDRKRTRTCTKHPMSNYLSYDKYSISYRLPTVVHDDDLAKAQRTVCMISNSIATAEVPSHIDE